MNISEAVTELEARIEAVERKNCLLERAFLAILDAGAGYDGGAGAREQRRSSGTESLYMGLENLLAVHAGEAGTPVAGSAGRLSTSSVP